MTFRQREKRAIARVRLLKKLGFKPERVESIDTVFLTKNWGRKPYRLTWFEVGAMSHGEFNYFLSRALNRPAIVNLHPDNAQLRDCACVGGGSSAIRRRARLDELLAKNRQQLTETLLGSSRFDSWARRATCAYSTLSAVFGVFAGKVFADMRRAQS